MNMDKLTFPADEKDQLEIYTHIGPFDKGVAALKNEGLELITSRELAEARMLCGAKHPVSKQWTWVAENFNYLPTGEILVASSEYNPILKNPEEAANCHRNHKEFYLNKKFAKALCDRAEVDPEKAIKSGVLLLKRKPAKSLREAVKNEIPTTDLEENPLTHFLFRELAKPYSQFLKENGIDKVPAWVVAPDYAANGTLFGRQLHVNILNHKCRESCLSGGDTVYDKYGRMRAVRRVPAEHSGLARFTGL